MDKSRRKELAEQFRQIPVMFGVFQLKNTVNGKIFIDSCPNFKNRYLTLKMELDDGRHRNSELQSDWREFGEASFEYSVLEEREDKDVADKRREMKQLLQKWLDKLRPYGETGYRKPKE
jgi:hypothetical protein